MVQDGVQFLTDIIGWDAGPGPPHFFLEPIRILSVIPVEGRDAPLSLEEDLLNVLGRGIVNRGGRLSIRVLGNSWRNSVGRERTRVVGNSWRGSVGRGSTRVLGDRWRGRVTGIFLKLLVVRHDDLEAVATGHWVF